MPTLTDAEDNPLMVRRKSKEALNGPVRRTTNSRNPPGRALTREKECVKNNELILEQR